MNARTMLDRSARTAIAIPAHDPASSDGFSLVELLIGLIVGLLLVAGVIQSWIAAAKTRGVQTELADSAERIRFAIEYLSRDLRLAGHDTAGPAIEFADGRLMARYDDVVVTYFVSGGSLRHRRIEGTKTVINNQPIVDGITSLAVKFGIGNPLDGRVRFVRATEAATAEELVNVWGVRVLLTIEGTGQLPSRAIESTVALRNPILARLTPAFDPLVTDDTDDQPDRDQPRE